MLHTKCIHDLVSPVNMCLSFIVSHDLVEISSFFICYTLFTLHVLFYIFSYF